MSDLAARIAERARARRLSRAVTVLVGVAGVALLAVLAWVVLASPWLTVRAVEVEGATGALAERVRAEVEQELDRPMARVDLDGAAERVESIAQVASADVTRSWPRTLRVTVVRRVAAAYLPTDGSGADRFEVVDGEGVVVRTAAEPPEGLPRVRVPRVGEERAPDPERVADALAVLAATPADVRERTLVVAARTPDDVRMRLRGGVQVRWGSTDHLERKTRVLTALMGQDARVYDVSAPDLPTTRD